MKAVAFILPLLANIAFGAVVLLLLIIMLNGYSERQATPGLIFFIIWILLSSLAAGVLSLFVMTRLVGRWSWGTVKAALTASAAFIVAGGISAVAAAFGAIAVIELLR